MNHNKENLIIVGLGQLFPMTQTEKLHFIKLDPLLRRNVDCEHRRAFSSYLVSEGSARVREC